MTIEGKVEAINPAQQISERFRKREFVVVTESAEHPQFIKIELHNDKCSLADGLTTGQKVKVHININGRKWNGGHEIQYFNSIVGWKIEKL